MDVWTGLAIGFFGSFHCIGMCGPIAIALPVFSDSQLGIIIGRILYNLGRVITYSLLGALFGLFGERLAITGLQQNLSIILGVIILIAVFTPVKYKNQIVSSSIFRRLTDFLKNSFAKIIRNKSNSSLFTIGLLNGLLPCGFVYVAIAGAITTGGVLSGTAFMALFGLGTFPIMLGASLIGKYINVNIRRKINRLIPALAVILAILFILRGLNLGIPYISPKLSTMNPNQLHLNHSH